MRPILPLLLLVTGCVSAGGPGDGPLPMMDGPGFFDRPFPTLARTRDDGTLDWSGFPGDDVPLLEQYLSRADGLVGAGTTAPLWVRFETPLDPTLLPSPEDSLGDDSPVWIVDVDPASPARGTRVPLQLEWLPDVATFLPGNLLAVMPLHGWPLRPDTLHALVLRSPIAGAPASVAAPEAPFTEETLRRAGVDVDALSLVVEFRTQAPSEELARMAEHVRGPLGKVPLGGALEPLGTGPGYSAWRGWVTLPDWQSGERPFRSSGGSFAFDADGTPRVQRWERVRFTLSVPNGRTPAGGWPVVLYSHGTGGDDTTFLGYLQGDGEAAVLARAGVAVIGVSQPLHGDRAPPGTNPELDSFNFLNIDSARSNFRQGALDQIYLAELLSAGPTFLADGTEVHLDPLRVVFMGHSQGGLAGGLAAPWMRERLRGAVLSGAGGGLAYTLMLRKDPVDFAALLAGAAGFAQGEEVTAGHPVTGLLQALAEVTDPVQTAPAWFATDSLPEVRGPLLPVLLTEGLQDPYTPAITAEALAAAARVPVVGDVAQLSDALRLRGNGPDRLPARDNALTDARQPVTAGLLQFPDDGHYAIYDNPRARGLYRRFVEDALAGAPAIGD